MRADASHGSTESHPCKLKWCLRSTGRVKLALEPRVAPAVSRRRRVAACPHGAPHRGGYGCSQRPGGSSCAACEAGLQGPGSSACRCPLRLCSFGSAAGNQGPWAGAWTPRRGLPPALACSPVLVGCPAPGSVRELAQHGHRPPGGLRGLLLLTRAYIFRMCMCRVWKRRAWPAKAASGHGELRCPAGRSAHRSAPTAARRGRLASSRRPCTATLTGLAGRGHFSLAQCVARRADQPAWLLQAWRRLGGSRRPLRRRPLQSMFCPSPRSSTLAAWPTTRVQCCCRCCRWAAGGRAGATRGLERRGGRHRSFDQQPCAHQTPLSSHPAATRGLTNHGPAAVSSAVPFRWANTAAGGGDAAEGPRALRSARGALGPCHGVRRSSGRRR